MTKAYELALEAAKAAADKKAFDIKILKIDQVSIIADYFVLATGNSSVQLKSIRENIEDELEKSGIKPFRKEGVREGRWVVLDYGDVIIHLFLKAEREFYDLESIWGDAEQEEFNASEA